MPDSQEFKFIAFHKDDNASSRRQAPSMHVIRNLQTVENGTVVVLPNSSGSGGVASRHIYLAKGLRNVLD